MNTFDDIIQFKTYPHLKYLCNRIYDDGDRMYLDGEKCFSKEEKFLPGTVISSFCYILTSCKKETDEYNIWLTKTKEMIVRNMDLGMDTFGILEFLSGLYELKCENIYDEIIDSTIQNKLKNNLHWNKFVNRKSLKLRNGLPTNYYGVAFRVALLREELGFENKGYSDKFLNILLDHIKRYSGEFLYMDETSGEGRYDKYTVTISSELCEALILVGKKPPKILYDLMKRSTDILLQLADEKGYGFTYGRSIGSHATGAVLENLPIAINMGIVDDSKFAYSYAIYTGKHMVDFWYNKDRKVFNIWDDGKKTDGYRGKHRVLEVNLDLSLKMIRANKFLQKSKWNTLEPYTNEEYRKILENIPKFKVFQFEKKTYERALAIYRSSKAIFSLPIISGGKKHFNNTAYLPIPFAVDFMMGSPDETHGVLVPEITLKDGKRLMPICYSKNISYKEVDNTYEIEYIQDEMCVIEEQETPYKGIKSHVKYILREDYIERIDEFRIECPQNIQNIRMLIDTYSDNYEVQENIIIFNNGLINKISVEGLILKEVKDISNMKEYDTPYKSLKTEIKYENTIVDNSFMIKTKIYY